MRAPLLTALVLMVLVALVVGACSVVSLGVMRPWWLSPRGFRVVGVEEAGSAGLLGVGACGLGELAAACLTGCGELSARPGRWGPGGQVSPVVGIDERRFNTAWLLSARLGVSRARAGQIVDHGNTLMNIGFNIFFWLGDGYS